MENLSGSMNVSPIQKTDYPRGFLFKVCLCFGEKEKTVATGSGYYILIEISL